MMAFLANTMIAANVYEKLQEEVNMETVGAQFSLSGSKHGGAK